MARKFTWVRAASFIQAKRKVILRPDEKLITPTRRFIFKGHYYVRLKLEKKKIERRITIYIRVDYKSKRGSAHDFKKEWKKTVVVSSDEDERQRIQQFLRNIKDELEFNYGIGGSFLASMAFVAGVERE